MVKNIALIFALWISILGMAQAAEAGKVVFVTGQAQVGGRVAAQDMAVQEGDELSTGAEAYVYVKTVDDGFLILRPNSKARVVAYSIDRKDPSKTQVKLELVQGVARAISGQGVKQARQNFRFNTPVAAIGVRGTDFTVYTDQQTTRVAVLSGGVVMSGFGAACTVAGTGPCEGREARELFAGQSGLLLQVERGNRVPQLLQNPALMPDQAEKPRSDEPAAKVVPAATPAVAVDLDPQRTARSLEGVHASVGTGPVGGGTPVVTPPPVVIVEPAPPVVQPEPPVVVEPPVVTPPVTPSKPASQEIFWGRWQAVAGYPARPGKVNDSDMATPVFAGIYAISRVNDTQLVMPKEGTASFKLATSEAMMQKDGGGYRLATVESGKLDVSFVDRTFATGLVVKAEADTVNLAGRGVITDKGSMLSNSSSSMFVRGYLGGPNAEQAGYVFQGTGASGVSVSGATTWTR